MKENRNLCSATRLLAAILLSLLSLPTIAGAQVIRLKEQASAEVKENVRLGDLASVTGVDARTAETLLNLVVLPEFKESRTLRAETILMAVIAQVGPGQLADRLQIAGSATCNVQVAQSVSPPGKTRPMTDGQPGSAIAAGNVVPATVNANQPASAPTNAAVAQPTLASLIMARLERDLNAHPGDLRVSFETMNPLLDQPVPAGRKWVFRPLTRSLLGTVQFEAQLVEAARIVQKFTIQLQVLRHQSVLMTAAPLARQDVVTQISFKRDETWLDRNMPTLLTDENEVLGLEALRDLPAGALLDQRDFKPVAMANRNDIISVIFVHGNIKVQMKGRAVQDGKLHDVVQVKNEATNEIYDAVLIGKRLAVIGGNLDEAQERQLREAR